MELVQFSKNGGPVSIDIDIVDTDVWSYIYVSDLTFTNKSSTGNPSHHILGLPVNLDDDINSWDIRLGNIGTSTVTVTVTITWKQDGRTLNVWSRSVNVPAGAATKISDDALLDATN